MYICLGRIIVLLIWPGQKLWRKLQGTSVDASDTHNSARICICDPSTIASLTMVGKLL